MLNQWDKKAIATIISALALLVSTGGLVGCGSNTPQENEADEQIDQNNNQRNESDNQRNEERDDNDQDDNDQDDNDRDDNDQDDNN